MSSDPGETTQSVNAKLEGVVQDAEELLVILKKKHDSETRVEAIFVGVVVGVAALVGLGVGSFDIYGLVLFSNPAAFFLVVTALAAASALFTYALRRRRRFPFAELNVLVAKMKEGKASSEDGLRLVDSMHEVTLAVKKAKVDSAFAYGAVAAVLVALFGLNVAIGLLTGVIVYLYFRYEALREYESESKKYEESKREFAQSL